MSYLYLKNHCQNLESIEQFLQANLSKIRLNCVSLDKLRKVSPSAPELAQWHVTCRAGRDWNPLGLVLTLCRCAPSYPPCALNSLSSPPPPPPSLSCSSSSPPQRAELDARRHNRCYHRVPQAAGAQEFEAQVSEESVCERRGALRGLWRPPEPASSAGTLVFEVSWDVFRAAAGVSESANSGEKYTGGA